MMYIYIIQLIVKGLWCLRKLDHKKVKKHKYPKVFLLYLIWSHECNKKRVNLFNK